MAIELKDFGPYMARAQGRLGGAVRAVVFRGGMNIKRSAKKRASKRVYLLSKIDVDVETKGDATTATIDTASPFGVIIEFGTPTFPGGKPFIGPGFAKEAKAMESFIISAVEKTLR